MHSRHNLHNITRHPQLETPLALVPPQRQKPPRRRLRHLRPRQPVEQIIVPLQVLLARLLHVDPRLDRREPLRRECRDPRRQRLRFRAQFLPRAEGPVDPADGRGGRGVGAAGGQDVLEGAGAADELDEELDPAGAGEETEAHFELGQEGRGPRVADVGLQGDFVAGAAGAAVDLGDEDDGEGGEEGAAFEDLEADFGGVAGGGDGVGGGEGVDVVVGDEEGGVGAGDDDDFGGGGGVGGGGEGGEEGGEVGGEFVVPGVDGGVVDGGADDVGGEGGGG